MPSLRSIAISVTIVPALLFTAACGSDSKSDDAKNSESVSTSSADSAAGNSGGGNGKVKSTEQLQKSLLAAADLGTGWEADPEGVGGDEKLTLLKEECQPVVGLFSPLSGATAPDGKAETGFTKDTSGLTVRLMSYKNAEKVMKDAESALAGCRLITAKDASGGSVSLTATAATAPKVGDQALAFSVNLAQNGESVHMSVSTVRTGSTLATLVTVSAADDDAAPADPAVLKKQLDKIIQAG